MLKCPTEKVEKNRKRTSKWGSPTVSKQSSGNSEADHQEFEAGMASPMPSREALVDHSKVSSNGDVQDPKHLDSEHEQAREAVRSPLQNHDRIDSGKVLLVDNDS